MTNGELNGRGHEAPTGPLLASAPWPQVLVTKARSLDDRSLDLTLHPHEHPAGVPVHLGFAQLDPGTRYTLRPSHPSETGSGHGTELVAAPDGTATVPVTLATTGGTRLRLEPMGAAS